MGQTRFEEFLCVWTFLLLSATPLTGGVTITESRLFVDGAAFPIRGAVYSPTPVGQTAAAVLDDAGCLFARDLPLIAAMGANTIRTTAMVRPGDRAFHDVLDHTRLYWLAGFPLEPYFDATRSLSPESPGGSALREEILTAFREFVEGSLGTRTLAFVFGDDVGHAYAAKFSGDAGDYYSLLAEAAAVARGIDTGALVTTTASDLSQIGSSDRGTNDAAQPDLAFWSLNRSGADPLDGDLAEARARTAKPVLISAFGIDAYDAIARRVDRMSQAKVARRIARGVEKATEGADSQVLGGVYAAFVDEWWRGGDAEVQGEAGTILNSSPDGVLNPAWLGLFRTAPSVVPGLDRIRPRDAYFALAEVWHGMVPSELTTPTVPEIAADGIRNMAGGLPLVAPGGLFVLPGSALTSAGRSVGAGDWPLQLGPVSVCMEGRPAPLVFAVENEIRGQVPGSTAPGRARAVVYRAGVPSDAAQFDVASAAPGIFEDGVFRPGRPCPVNEENGVPPGSYLEIYGSGLGGTGETIPDGVALPAAQAFPAMPLVTFRDRPLPVLFSGLLPGTPGVTQTNVAIADDFPAGSAGLSVERDGIQSNVHRLRVTTAQERPRFHVTLDGPDPVVLQAGGPAQTVFVLLNGYNGFCDLVRFELDGVATGVRATVPVGVPGQTLPLTLQAHAGAPPVQNDPMILTGRSIIPEAVNSVVRVTVLPSLGMATYRVVSGGWLSTVPVASFELNGNLLYRATGGGAGRGFNFMTIDPNTGILGPVRSFDTWASDAAVVAMEDYLKSLTEGVVVFGAIADDGFFKISDETRRVIRQTLGSGLIDKLEYRYSWAIMARKGVAQPIDEGLSPNGLVVLTQNLTFPID